MDENKFFIQFYLTQNELICGFNNLMASRSSSARSMRSMRLPGYAQPTISSNSKGEVVHSVPKYKSIESPKLKKNDIELVIRETDFLISQISEEKEVFKGDTNNKDEVILYYNKSFKKLEDKLISDRKLIHNVLELNNSISSQCTILKNKIRLLEAENLNLKTILSNR